MIAPCGTFDYRVVVKRDPDAQYRWLGRAYTIRDSSIHPGMLGRRPLFALENGYILLRTTESRLSILTNTHYRRWGRPAVSASFEVGNTPAAVIQQDDRFLFTDWRGRPKDFHLTFAIAHERIKLCEGEEAYIGEYYVRVERVSNGLPGELSSLIVRTSSALTNDMAIESARLMANAPVKIRR